MKLAAYIVIGPPCPCHAIMSEWMIVAGRSVRLAETLLQRGDPPLAVMVEVEHERQLRHLLFDTE